MNTFKSTVDDLKSSFVHVSDHVIRGDMADSEASIVDDIGSIVMGIFGVDLLQDVGALVYDVKNWKTKPGNFLGFTIDLMALLPVVGAAKYSDEAADIGKAVKKKIIKNSDEIVEGTSKSVYNMSEFFADGFGKSIKNNLSKTSLKYNGQAIYKVTAKTENDYLKKGYGVYLDALHKDHLEVIDKVGKVKYVLNLDGTLNVDKTKKAVGRIIKGW